MELTPKEFEILLCEFCKQDLPKNFSVEHDIKEIGGESGNKRQIDTKIRGRLGISDILICGEAKYWNEVVGIETIDGLVGKYQSGEIRANKVIIFSNQGYSKPAINRAKHLGIELLEPIELGNPIKKIPYIIGIGYLEQMSIETEYDGIQKNVMALDINDYVILKGSERITFQQNVYRNISNQMGEILTKDIFTDLSSITITESNVLYELKFDEGCRYNATFIINASIKWDYFVEDLNAGVLHHLNSKEDKFVNLQGSRDEILKKVLLSKTKRNYELKDDLINEIKQKGKCYSLQLYLTDPDRNKTHPFEPIFNPL